MARSLTVKQGSFCQKYLECGNASEAYRFAYNCEKMKPETIKRKAAEVMANGNVTATLNNLRAKAEERAELKMDEVVRLLSDAPTMSLRTGKSGWRTSKKCPSKSAG